MDLEPYIEPPHGDADVEEDQTCQATYHRIGYDLVADTRYDDQ